MAGFKRVYTQFPGYNILGNIESVNTIDIAPPSTPLGSGLGLVAMVGEFEDGPFETPTQVFGGSDLEATFGGFGHTYNGVQNVYPVAAKSAGVNAANVWNGSGFIHLRNKRFSGLVIVRVDNTSGEVTFQRLACSVGLKGPYAGLANGDTVACSVNGAANVTATIAAAVASITGTSGTYPTTFVGGETLELSIDGGETITVIFTDADQSNAQVVTRINSVTASSIASVSGGELKLDSRTSGWSGSIEVVGGTALATLGLPAAPTPQVNDTTVNSNTGGGDFTLRTTIVTDGVSVDYDATYTAGGADTVTVVRDGVLAAALLLGIPGVTFAAVSTDGISTTGDDNVLFTQTLAAEAEPGVGDMTTVFTTPGVVTLASGTGNVADVDLITQAEITSLLSALTGITADADTAGKLRICATTTPATGTLYIDPTSTAAEALGLTTGVTISAAGGVATTIPAGTRIRDTVTGFDYVVAKSVTVAASTGGPYTAKVRPGLDNDTTPTAAAGNLTQIVDALPDGFVVTNAADCVRLSAAQMDVRYLAAIDSTIDVSGIPYEINTIVSARSTERIGLALKANALEATASGHKARKAVFAPPIGTTRAAAKASTGIGVGNIGREQRLFYTFPGMATYIPEIAAKGTDGGTGFTEDGIIDVRSDVFYASVASILPPEENRGQQLSDTNYGALAAVGLEDAYNKEQAGIGLKIEDYIDFKAAGIIAPRNDRVAGLVFQSDITSVNPSTQPGLVDAKRRFMGDFLIDSLSDIGVGYVKKLNSPIRRRAFFATVNAYLEILASPNQPDASRIEDYAATDETSEALRALGFQIIDVRVQLFASMDYIVYRTTVGTTVNVEELA